MSWRSASAGRTPSDQTRGSLCGMAVEPGRLVAFRGADRQLTPIACPSPPSLGKIVPLAVEAPGHDKSIEQLLDNQVPGA